jgi:hypothetical protein
MRHTIATLGATGLLTALLLTAPAPEARGQGAIGFQPVVTPFADGVFLNATPVVSADRRYVRIGGINASFQALRGVQPFTFTAGGVAGGGIGGGFGGFGGLGNVGGLGAVSNFGNVGVVPGLGLAGPVGFPAYGYGWPGSYGGYPYTVSGIPAGPLYTGPMWMPPQTINALVPTGGSIMNSIAPGSWRFGGW